MNDFKLSSVSPGSVSPEERLVAISHVEELALEFETYSRRRFTARLLGLLYGASEGESLATYDPLAA